MGEIIAKIIELVLKNASEETVKIIVKGVKTGAICVGAGYGAKLAAEGISDAVVKIGDANAIHKAMAEHPELISDDIWHSIASNSKSPKKGIWANGPKKSHADSYV